MVRPYGSDSPSAQIRELVEALDLPDDEHAQLLTTLSRARLGTKAAAEGAIVITGSAGRSSATASASAEGRVVITGSAGVCAGSSTKAIEITGTASAGAQASEPDDQPVTREDLYEAVMLLVQSLNNLPESLKNNSDYVALLSLLIAALTFLLGVVKH